MLLKELTMAVESLIATFLKTATFQTRYEKDLLGGVNLIQTTGKSIRGNDKGDGLKVTDKVLTAIPYYAWNNRGAGEMQVWMPRTDW